MRRERLPAAVEPGQASTNRALSFDGQIGSNRQSLKRELPLPV